MRENKKQFIKISNLIFEDRLVTNKEVSQTSRFISLYIKMAASRNTLDNTLDTTMGILIDKMGLDSTNGRNTNSVRESLEVLENNGLINVDRPVKSLKKNDPFKITFYEEEDETFTKVYLEDLKVINTFNNIDLTVYFCIKRFRNNNENSKAWVSVDTMRKRTGLSKKTILSSIKKLKELNFISVEQKGDCKYNSKAGTFVNPHNTYYFTEVTEEFVQLYQNYKPTIEYDNDDEEYEVKDYLQNEEEFRFENKRNYIKPSWSGIGSTTNSNKFTL